MKYVSLKGETANIAPQRELKDNSAAIWLELEKNSEIVKIMHICGEDSYKLSVA